MFVIQPKYQYILIFSFFLILTWFLEFKFRLILMGAALILWAPFLIMERFMIPGIRRFPRLVIVLALLVEFAGGMCWYYAFRM